MFFEGKRDVTKEIQNVTFILNDDDDDDDDYEDDLDERATRT